MHPSQVAKSSSLHKWGPLGSDVSKKDDQEIWREKEATLRGNVSSFSGTVKHAMPS